MLPRWPRQRQRFAILDKHLADKTYLVGEQFSLADVCYMPFLEFLPLMEIAPPTAVAAWSQRLLARPSAAATRPLFNERGLHGMRSRH